MQYKARELRTGSGCKPSLDLSILWLEATWATALAACWRMDASEDSTICDQPLASHQHVVIVRSLPSAAFPQRRLNTVDLGERQRATLWKWSKPAIAISTGWLEATWATALAACWRMDASEESTNSDQPRGFPTKCGHCRSRDRAAFHRLVHGLLWT